MRWRWPPWRREEPEVQGIEVSGETVGQAKRQTIDMELRIKGRAEEVRTASDDLAKMIMKSMEPRRESGT